MRELSSGLLSIWKLCDKHSNLFMWNAAATPEQKSALELIPSCAFRILVCFLPE